MPHFKGACHCGAVQFSVDADFDELTQCDCSLCAKKNALMGKVHESRLSILAGEDKLTLYQWNTRVAQHYFCSVCGIYTFHRKRSAPDHYGVNVMCLEDFDLKAFPVRLASGKDMSVQAEGAHYDWPGPRVGGPNSD